MSWNPLPPLSPLEARVLAVLVEKERTVPDTYPLTLNALTAGCNQKSSRNPVINASEAEVQAAVEQLRRYSLVIESSGSRVMRYSQNVKRVLGLPSQSVALLATLALRGPQTAAELRANSDRIHSFADVSSVEGFLREMAERPEGALVVLLPRQAGAREARWAHLLSGPVTAGSEGAQRGTAARSGLEETGLRPDEPGLRADEPGLRPDEPGLRPDEPGLSAGGFGPVSTGTANRSGDSGNIATRLARLEDEVAQLRSQLARLLAERDGD